MTKMDALATELWQLGSSVLILNLLILPNKGHINKLHVLLTSNALNFDVGCKCYSFRLSKDLDSQLREVNLKILSVTCVLLTLQYHIGILHKKLQVTIILLLQTFYH